jgi:hypothetical protein
MFRFKAGLTLILLTLIGAIRMIGGRAELWLHPAVMALAFVVLIPLFAARAVWSRRELGEAYDAAFRPCPAPAAAAAIRVWRFLEAACYLAGILALLSGLIVTFSLLSANLANLGAKLAACLVAPFYALVLALAARILAARVEQTQG